MSRLPELLRPYLALPGAGSLVLLTGVQGAGTNWLVMRYMASFLAEGVGVVVVSFLRDWSFWRETGGKIGLDLDGLSRTGRLIFVDGLTGLYTGGHRAGEDRGQAQTQRILQSDALVDVRGEISGAARDVRGDRKVLILDGLDEWLAASEVDVSAVEGMLLSLREDVHATVLTLAADYPLVHGQTTSLERSHAALVLSQAHAADVVLSLRMLDTGVARDVSGVVRITVRGDGGPKGGPGDGDGEDGREYLYHVGGDGGVKVFERGEVRAR